MVEQLIITPAGLFFAKAMDQSAIELVAKTMIWLFEADAIPELRRRAASALDTGNTEEFEGWQKILQAVRLLQLPIAAE